MALINALRGHPCIATLAIDGRCMRPPYPAYHTSWQPCLQYLPSLSGLYLPCVADVAGVMRDIATCSNLADLTFFPAPYTSQQIDEQVAEQVANQNPEQQQGGAEAVDASRCGAYHAFSSELLRHSFSSVKQLDLQWPSHDYKYAGMDLGRQLVPLLEKHTGVRLVRALVDALSVTEVEAELRQACMRHGVRVVRCGRGEAQLERVTGQRWVPAVSAELCLADGRRVELLLVQQLSSDWEQAQLDQLALLRWG